jgi:hypothetical protein
VAKCDTEHVMSRRLGQLKSLAKDATTPLAARLVHEIVIELENRLRTSQPKSQEREPLPRPFRPPS